jgi:hypothetical protein
VLTPLEQALAQLPGTADGIAEQLHAGGIKGVRADDGCCPLAVYLTGLGFDTPSVDVGTISAWIDGDEPQYESEWTPSHVEDFIRRFDAGAWPELVSDPEADDA